MAGEQRLPIAEDYATIAARLKRLEEERAERYKAPDDPPEENPDLDETILW